MSQWRVILIAAICAVYVAARFWRLGDSCLWFDEMFSVQAAEQPWGEMFRFLALDLVHPPLFYILLKVWIAIGGDGVFWVRLLPVIFGCLCVIPFLLLCREMKQSFAATAFALFLLAVNGSLIKYAQEVRMYTMLMFLSLCSMWLFARYFYRGKSLGVLLVVNIVMVFTHYYGWAVIGCEVLAILMLQRIKWRQMIAMAGITFSAFLPWMLVVITTARSGDLGENIDWIKRPGFRVLFDYLFDLIEPFYFQTSSAEPASIYLVTLPIILIVSIAGTIFAVDRKGNENERPFVGLLLVFSVATVAVVFAASWLLPYSVWGTRHLIIVVAPIMLLVANAITGLPSNISRTAAISLVVLFSGYAAYFTVARESPQYVWCGWESLMPQVEPERGASDPVKIYASENLAAYHSWFATRRDSERFEIFIVKAPTGEFIDREYFPPRGFDGITRATTEDISAERIVLLYRLERPNLTDWLRRRLEESGYTACLPTYLTFGPSTLVSVEMMKDSGRCVSPAPAL